MFLKSRISQVIFRENAQFAQTLRWKEDHFKEHCSGRRRWLRIKGNDRIRNQTRRISSSRHLGTHWYIVQNPQEYDNLIGQIPYH